MKRFFRHNGFIKVPRKEKNARYVYYNPGLNVFITIYKDGNFSITTFGDNIYAIEYWQEKLNQYLESNKKIRSHSFSH